MEPFTRSSSVVPSTPPCTYSTASHGVGGRVGPFKCVLPVSTKRTTNGQGGMRSLRRPSATASFCTRMPAEFWAPDSAVGVTILITTGAMPSGA